MATTGTIVSKYAEADVNLTALMDSADTQRKRYEAVSLTEYDTDVLPQIAAGSKIEVNGALYEFDSDTDISGSPSDGTVYIRMIPSGSEASRVITPTWTNTAPTWSDTKQGWYGTVGAANYRYVNFIMTKSGTNYTDKRYYLDDPLKNIKNLNNVTIGSLDITAFPLQSLAEDGYIKLGPIYIQWGFETSIGTSSNRTIDFPVEFPNNTYTVVTSCQYGTTVTIDSITTAHFRIVNASGAGGTGQFGWIAIGN